MTETKIFKAKNFDDMESIAEPFIDHGYKIMSADAKHIIAKKRNFGNRYVHILFLFLILFIIGYNSGLLYIVCVLYIVYFVFFLFQKSKIVLITTETKDTDGNPVEFDSLDDINLANDEIFQ